MTAGTVNRDSGTVPGQIAVDAKSNAWRVRGPRIQTVSPRIERLQTASSSRIPAASGDPLVPESAEPIPFTLRVPMRAPTSSFVIPVLVSESRSRMASPAQHLVKSRSCVSFTSFLLPSRVAFQIELFSWSPACVTASMLRGAAQRCSIEME